MLVTPVERLIAALEPRLSVPVVTKVPRDPPALFVRLDAAAPRSVTPVTDDTLIAVQVYGADQGEVVDTLLALRFVLMDEVYASDPKIVWWAEEAGPHEFPDPDDGATFRWQFTGILTTTLT